VGWRDRLAPHADQAWEKSWVGLVGKLVPVLQGIHPEYAFGEALALRLYGGTPWDQQVQVALTQAGWEKIREVRPDGLQCYGGPDRPEGLSFEDVPYRANVHVCPETVSQAQTCYGLRVVPLATLIVPRLRSVLGERRNEVTSLIRANGLGETFLAQLPPDLHAAYLNCLRPPPRKTRR
jgi:hypothetical protein